MVNAMKTNFFTTLIKTVLLGTRDCSIAVHKFKDPIVDNQQVIAMEI